MRHTYLCSLAVLMVAVLFAGCGRGNPGEVPVLPQRGIQLDAGQMDSQTVNGATGTAPLAVHYLPTVIRGEGDTADYSTVSAVEIDPGDGSGWLDVTAEWRSYMALIAAGTERTSDDLLKYTYRMQGEFAMLARVRFTDGDVHYMSEYGYLEPPLIRVLPYAEDTMVSFTDPRDGSVRDVIDGRVIIAFVLPLDREAADRFIADMELDVHSEWWEAGGIGAYLPAHASVLEAVRDWPALYPEVIDTVDPDELADFD